MTKMGRLDTLPTAESLQRAERYSPFRFRAFHSKDSRRCKSRRKDRSKASYNKVQTPRNLGRHTPLSFHLGAACTSASETGYGSLVFCSYLGTVGRRVRLRTLAPTSPPSAAGRAKGKEGQRQNQRHSPQLLCTESLPELYRKARQKRRRKGQRRVCRSTF